MKKLIFILIVGGLFAQNSELLSLNNTEEKVVPPISTPTIYSFIIEFPNVELNLYNKY